MQEVYYSDQSHWVEDAIRIIFNNFKGKTVPLEEIRDFVLADTPFRFLKEILRDMEKNGKIIDVSGRTRKTLNYADGCTVKFLQ